MFDGGADLWYSRTQMTSTFSIYVSVDNRINSNYLTFRISELSGLSELPRPSEISVHTSKVCHGFQKLVVAAVTFTEWVFVSCASNRFLFHWTRAILVARSVNFLLASRRTFGHVLEISRSHRRSDRPTFAEDQSYTRDNFMRELREGEKRRSEVAW